MIIICGIEVGAHDHGIFYCDIAADMCAHTDDAFFEHGGGADEATVGNEAFSDGAGAHASGGKEAGACEYGGVSIGEVEGRIGVGECEVGVVEGADRTDVFPITVEEMSLDAVAADGHGEDVAAEVFVSCGFEEIDKEVAIEQVDAHRRKVLAAAGFDTALVDPGGWCADAVEGRIIFGFFDEAGDFTGVIELHDAEAAGRGAGHGYSGDGDISVGGQVRFEHGSEVHAVELVAGEDEDVADAVFSEEADLFANGVSGALIPVGTIEGLLGGEDFDKAVVEQVEIVGLSDVTVETDGIELGEDVDAADIAVDAVGNGYVDEAILATEWYSGFGAVFGKWEEACAFTSTEDQADSVAHGIIRGDEISWMGQLAAKIGERWPHGELTMHKQCPSQLIKSTFSGNASHVKNVLSDRVSQK